MKNSPHVAVVLLNYNGRNFLERNIPFLLQTTYPDKKIYVIDNASSDDSVSFLKEYYPAVEIIEIKSNKGYAGGYNEGLKKIKADYYILINTDVEVTPGFIEPLITIMENNPGVVICQPKILSLQNRHQFEYAGAAGGFMDLYGYTFARGRILDQYEVDNGQYDSDCDIFWAGGACFAMKAAVFHDLNGFYRYFFMYFEEADLCWRAKQNGYQVYYSHASVVYHRQTDQFIRQPAYRIFYVFRNNLIMLMRNLPWPTRLMLVPIRIVLNLAAAFLFLTKGYPRNSWAVLKSIAAALYWLLTVHDIPAGKKAALNKLKGVYKKSILAAYYLKKKRTFNSLSPEDFT
jgi:GT2 family glycosyltransferase